MITPEDIQVVVDKLAADHGLRVEHVFNETDTNAAGEFHAHKVTFQLAKPYPTFASASALVSEAITDGQQQSIANHLKSALGVSGRRLTQYLATGRPVIMVSGVDAYRIVGYNEFRLRVTQVIKNRRPWFTDWTELRHVNVTDTCWIESTARHQAPQENPERGNGHALLARFVHNGFEEWHMGYGSDVWHTDIEVDVPFGHTSHTLTISRENTFTRMRAKHASLKKFLWQS